LRAVDGDDTADRLRCGGKRSVEHA
jgi:hypothetical protein